jgi:hypothetical protein
MNHAAKISPLKPTGPRNAIAGNLRDNANKIKTSMKSKM